MTYLYVLLAMAIGFAGLMALAWAIQQRTGNSGWVDTIWTYSLGLIGVVGALWPLDDGALPARQWLVAGLAAAWSLRLGTHIALRTVHIEDDPRYAEYAKAWGADAPQKMFVFLQQQAAGSLPLVFAIFLAAHAPRGPLGIQDAIGALILAIAIGGEALSDAQLKQFRADPQNKGKVNDAGLWGWSRHPNYFFEWFGWLAYPVMAIAPGHPWGWAALLAPVFMYWILVYVTGIPPLEKQMEKSRGNAWRSYEARTSKFFPLPPGAG